MKGTFFVKNDEETKTLLSNTFRFCPADINSYFDDNMAIKAGDKLARFYGEVYLNEFRDENAVFNVYMIEE